MKNEMNEIQKYELEILKSFDEICKTHGLYYSLAGGSMLGAIRHKGFIPWDDDIDVCLPRPDYEKLIKISSGFSKSNRYQLIGFEKGNFVYPFLKYCDTKVEIYAPDSRSSAAKFLNIDILPVDGLPDSDKKIRKIYKKSSTYRKILLFLLSDYREDKRVIHKLLKFLVLPFLKSVGIKKYAKKLIAISNSREYEFSKKVGIVAWGLYGYHEVMDKKSFEKTAIMQFETMEIACMSCWDEYLNNLYNDYMKLPAIDKRESHNINIIIK